VPRQTAWLLWPANCSGPVTELKKGNTFGYLIAEYDAFGRFYRERISAVAKDMTVAKAQEANPSKIFQVTDQEDET